MPTYLSQIANPDVRKALSITPASPARDRTIDITTTGAKTGRPRRIEVWFYRVADNIYLSTSPARRDWYANLVADPRFTFHLKHGIRRDLLARGTAVLNPAERATVFASIVNDLNQPWNPAGIAQPVEPLDDWIAGSPLVLVELEQVAA